MAISHKLCDRSICGIFGTNFAIKTFSKVNGTIANMRTIRNNEVGSRTEAWLTLDYLLANKIKVDRMILLSDMQCYDSGFKVTCRDYFGTQTTR